MKTGQAILGGICYRLSVHEGMATFVERDGMSAARITVQKCSPTGLLYVQVSASIGFVPFGHIRRAVEICETFMGPNHYTSLADMHRCERNIAFRHIWKRPVPPLRAFFWRHCLPFRIRSLGVALRHQFRLICPERTPRVEWIRNTVVQP